MSQRARSALAAQTVAHKAGKLIGRYGLVAAARWRRRGRFLIGLAGTGLVRPPASTTSGGGAAAAGVGVGKLMGGGLARPGWAAGGGADAAADRLGAARVAWELCGWGWGWGWGMFPPANQASTRSSSSADRLRPWPRQRATTKLRKRPANKFADAPCSNQGSDSLTTSKMKRTSSRRTSSPRSCARCVMLAKV